MQLRPGEKYIVVRQLADPTDTGTYYVRAIIRDSKTDEILDTLELIDKGGQRFTKEWQVSPDPSGLGRWIDVETNVYTDSGYTTLSTEYNKESKTLLIQERMDGVFGPGGSDISYKKIREIIEDVLANKKEIEVKVEKTEIPEKIDLKPLEKAIDRLYAKISVIHEKPSDNSAITSELKEIRSLVSDKKDTGQIEAILEQIRGLAQVIKAKKDENQEKKDYSPYFEGLEEKLQAIAKWAEIELPKTKVIEKPKLITTRKRKYESMIVTDDMRGKRKRKIK